MCHWRCAVVHYIYVGVPDKFLPVVVRPFEPVLSRFKIYFSFGPARYCNEFRADFSGMIVFGKAGPGVSMRPPDRVPNNPDSDFLRSNHRDRELVYSIKGFQYLLIPCSDE